MGATSSLRSMTGSAPTHTWKRPKSGVFFTKSSTDSITFTLKRLCTEISRMQISFWLRVALSNLETWMFRKLQSKSKCKLKLALLTMPHLRCGKTNLMINRQTFGHLELYSMRWLHYRHLSQQRIWKHCTIVSLRAFILKFHQTSLPTCPVWSLNCFKLTLREDQAPNKFFTCQSLLPNTMRTKKKLILQL